MTLKEYQGNFGRLQLHESDGTVSGQYADGGVLTGTVQDGVYTCTWKNQGEVGLLTFQIEGNQLKGKWKRGLEPGAMRGKWEGHEIFAPARWTILHDLGVFYIFFANLAESAAQQAEIRFVNQAIRRWDLQVGNVAHRFEALTDQEKDAYFDEVYDALYVDSNGEPTRDPFTQLNTSHAHIIGYYNDGILPCENIRTLFFSVYELCQINGITPEQAHQLHWFINHWKGVCPKLESIEVLLDLSTTQEQLRKLLGDSGIDPTALPSFNPSTPPNEP